MCHGLWCSRWLPLCRYFHYFKLPSLLSSRRKLRGLAESLLFWALPSVYQRYYNIWFKEFSLFPWYVVLYQICLIWHRLPPLKGGWDGNKIIRAKSAIVETRGQIVPDISAYSNYPTVPPVHITESELSVKGSFFRDLGLTENVLDTLVVPVSSRYTTYPADTVSGCVIVSN